MLKKLLIACVLFSLFWGESSGYNLTVKTEHGYVQGREATSLFNSNVTYYAFQGVPYGKSPLGSLRFQDPQPVESWDGVVNATSFKPQCASFETTVVGSEDCLYVNVYVPKFDKKNEELSLPVIAWFHGGGFVSGSAQQNPSYFMEKPVIIVTIAYRLGPLGFLSTLDENARGNAGLKDQNLALKWIQNNIGYFGGNSSRVTTFGQSAGAASVEYHIVSPKSSGLFSQAIANSGSTLNEWGFRKDPLDHTKRLARLLNITTNDTKEIVEQLQAIDYVTLVENGLVGEIGNKGRFSPIVEVDSENAFMNQSTYDLWSSGKFNKVPLLRGYNNEEGAYRSTTVAVYAEDPKNLIPAGLNIDLNSTEADEVVNGISGFYFPEKSLDNFTNCINFMTQHYFVRGIRKTVADYEQSSTPLYFYRFSYVTKEKYTAGVNGGAGHSEEQVYIWYSTKLLNDEDILMKDRLITLLTNFVIYGNPTPEEDPLLENVIWPEATEGVTSPDDVRYLEIGRNLTAGTNPDQPDFQFWRALFKLYAKPPIYTY